MPDLLVNGDIISDTKQKADSLNEYFKAQTQIPNETNSPIPLVSLSTHSLSVVETNELEVLNLLSNVDVSKACGLDNDQQSNYQTLRYWYSQTFYSLIKYLVSPWRISKRLEIGQCDSTI